jgi:FlaG/FlaF family flagellin (archaellin)
MPHPHPDDAVADTVGAILMVAITVVMAVVLSLLLFAFKGPVATPQANLAVSLDAGGGGWGTGDESIRVQHNGGEALPATSTSIVYTVNGVPTVLRGASLGGPFATGALNLGETWTRTLTLASTDKVTASVVAGGGARTVLVASATLKPGSISGAGCVFDATLPTVQSLTHLPSLGASSPASTATVTLVVQDNCSVNIGVAPLLEWGYLTLNAGAFPNSATMAFQGGTTWTGSISPVQTWSLHAGDTLQYRVSGYKDMAGNTGATATGSDLIDLLPPTYPSTQTPTVVGAPVPALSTVQAADGTEGSFVEALSTTSGQVSSAGVTGTVGTGAASDAKNSDEARAGLSSTSHSVTATGFTSPGAAAGISHVIIGFEGRQSAALGTPPTATISYTVSGVAGASSTTKTVNFFSASAPFDTTYTLDVTADRAWTPTDLTNLAVKVQGASFGGGPNKRNVEVDQVFVQVTYDGAGPPRTLALQYDWGVGGVNVVPTGAVQTLEMRYYVTASADTFTAQAYDFTAGTWRSCATPLAATTALPTVPNFTCALSGAGEFNSGSPRIRIFDNSASSTTATTLFLDYVRVVTT